MSEESLFDGSDDGSFVPFTDMLFNVVMGFSFMVFIAFALIRPEAMTGNVDIMAEYIITVTWPEGHPDDIDTYVMDPGGNIVWYNNKEAGLLHLDRDDRGNFRDTVVINGQRIENLLNQETVTLRGIVAGEYVVNVQHYVANGIEPVPISVKVERVNPTLQVIYYGSVELDHRGDEETVVRFTLDAEGNPSNLNDRQISLTQRVRGGDQGVRD
ncbi:MAG: hypothetical protein KIS96_03250 [Bauldia sp.]|nr:hypothetical protein [Bauldia sp.]MCW5777607.1 hypothetical protein [Phycisphaeraceae bacterium]